MRRLVAACLLIEGFASGVRAASLPTLLQIYPAATIVVMLARVVVGILEFTSGWMIWQRHPFGPRLGALALVISALLLVLEVGFGLSASSIFHSYRWPFVIGYATYALAGAWILRPRADVD